MTNVPIEEQLGFDISQALTGIGQIDDALSQVVQSFSVGLASALETLTSAGADVQPLAESLDIAGLGPAIDTALAEAGSAPVDVTVDADTAPLTEAIDTATGVDPVLALDADTAKIDTAIEELTVEPIELTVDADTASAQEAIGQLGGSASGAASNLDQLSGGVEALSASTGLAKGEVGALGGFISNISPAAAEAVTGLAAVAALVGESSSLAADASAQNARFASTFGDLAEQVNQVPIGDLTIDIADLGRRSGTTNADLQATASRIGQLGRTSGATDQAIVGTTQKLLALGATVSVNNPRLGDAAEVTDRLGVALAKGGKGLAAFGIGLTASQITQEAFSQTGKTNVADLTQFEKITAGASLAAAQFGDTLGTKFTAGSQNAQVQLRALKTQVEETLVTVGGPLLEPLVQSLTDLLPVAEQVGIVLGDLANVVLPAFSALAPAVGLLAAPLGLIGDGLGVLAALPGPVILGLAGLTAALVIDTATLYAWISAEALAAEATALMGNPIAIAAAGLAALGIAAHFAGQGIRLAAVDTSALDALFTTTGAGAQSLTIQISGLADAVSDYLKTQLAVKVQGQTELEFANSLGISYAQLSTAISGNAVQYAQLASRIGDSVGADFRKNESAANLLDTLVKGRQVLQDNAALALQAAVSDGTLTEAQLDAAVAAATAGGATADQVAILAELSPTIDKAAVAQTRAANAAALTGGAYKKLAQQIADGTVSAADAAAVATQLGISEADATTIINDQVSAITEQNDKRIEATASAQLLRAELEAGTISAADAQIGFLQLGISLQGTSDLLDEASRAAKDNADALAKQSDKTLLASDAARALRLELASGQITTEQAEASFIRMGVSVGGAKDEIDATNSIIDQFVSKGLSALPAAGAAISQFGSDLSSAVHGVASAVESADGEINAAVLKANDQVLQDLDPQRMIDALNLQILSIVTFQQHIDTLIQRGRINVAAALIAEGPDAGGIAAATLVSDDTKAQVLDSGFALGSKVRQGFRDDLLGHRSELAGVLVTLADGSVVDASTLIEQAGHKAGSALLTGIATPINASTAVKDAIRRLREGGAAAFDPNLAAPAKDAALTAGKEAQAGFVQGFQPDKTATDAIAKIPAAITSGIQPAIGASTTAGVDVTAFFAGHLHFGGEVTANMGSIPGRIERASGTNNLVAAGAGFELGVAYGEGFAGGLGSAIALAATAAAQLAAAADRAARKQLGVRSPSSVGKDLGRQYVAGVVQGLSELDPLHAATAALTLALVPDLRPALRQTPSLAPGIVAASSTPAVSRLAGASTAADTPASTPIARRVESVITLNKTDPDPKHLADEIAWALQ